MVLTRAQVKRNKPAQSTSKKSKSTKAVTSSRAARKTGRSSSASSAMSLTSSMESTANDTVRRRTKKTARKHAIRPARSGSTSASSSSGIPNEGELLNGGFGARAYISPKIVQHDGTTLRNVRRRDWNLQGHHDPWRGDMSWYGIDDTPEYILGNTTHPDIAYHVFERPVRRYGNHKGGQGGPRPVPANVPGKALSAGSCKSDKSKGKRRRDTPSSSYASGPPDYRLHTRGATIGYNPDGMFPSDDEDRFQQMLWDEDLNMRNGAGPAPR